MSQWRPLGKMEEFRYAACQKDITREGLPALNYRRWHSEPRGTTVCCHEELQATTPLRAVSCCQERPGESKRQRKGSLPGSHEEPSATGRSAASLLDLITF